MPKVYLIGGSPRTGKTYLTKDLLKQKPILATSTDAIRYMLRQIKNAEDEPDLFHLGKFTSNDAKHRKELLNEPEKFIDLQNKESKIVWKSLLDYIHSNMEDGQDILIEGIAVLPELVSKLECEFNAIFIGNKSIEHYETILKIARQDEYDWMHNL